MSTHPRSAGRGRPSAPAAPRQPRAPRFDARRCAVELLAAVDDGAYANLALPELLQRAEARGPVDERDKAFTTELAYGTVRMRRACSWLVDQHVTRRPDPDTERVLHLGAYQLAFLGTAAHAAVSATVEIAPARSRGFVNAVLRRVAAQCEHEIAWPDTATALSYPDWIVEALQRDLGEVAALGALVRMNQPATVHRRDDGYVQDPASQQVAALVSALPGERVLDVCAAPGGKATAIAAAVGGGGHVVAVDLHPHRARLVARNVRSLGLRDRVSAVVADGRRMPFPTASFDRVLLDAPCSGLGSLRRRPDARWRITRADVDDLVQLQRELLRAAVSAVRIGGHLVYSVCTLTEEETIGVADWALAQVPGLEAAPRPAGDGWSPLGSGSRLLPGDTDGMCVFAFRRTA